MAHALCARDFGGEALFGEAPIVQSGERIDHRQIAQAVELRVFIGKLGTQLLDEKLLANRIDVEKDDQRDQSKDGFGETDFKESAGTLMRGHRGEGDDRTDEKHADKNGIAAQRRVAFLDQRQFVLEFARARVERARDKIDVRGTHVRTGSLAPEGQIRGRKIYGQWNFGLRG